jgi:hypothetical protein
MPRITGREAAGPKNVELTPGWRASVSPRLGASGGGDRHGRHDDLVQRVVMGAGVMSRQGCRDGRGRKVEPFHQSLSGEPLPDRRSDRW